MRDVIDVLKDIAKLRRYNPNHLKRKVPYPARHLTLNMPVEILNEIDEILAEMQLPVDSIDT